MILERWQSVESLLEHCKRKLASGRLQEKFSESADPEFVARVCILAYVAKVLNIEGGSVDPEQAKYICQGSLDDFLWKLQIYAEEGWKASAEIT